MRPSFFKKCAWVLLALWISFYAEVLWHAPEEWLELTGLFVAVGGIAAWRFFEILNAPKEFGYFAEELPEKIKPREPIQSATDQRP
jgi:hypothetical protein